MSDSARTNAELVCCESWFFREAFSTEEHCSAFAGQASTEADPLKAPGLVNSQRSETT